MTWWQDLFDGQQRAAVPVDRLSFDPNNPRYTPDKRPRNDSEAAVLEYLDRTADLGELVESIAASGYIDIEPIIVVGRGEDLIVLEGNRRVAALKALLHPDLAKSANVSIPALSQEVREGLANISAYKVAHEQDAKELIGFKHINGPQGWDAYAKALYAARWLDEQADLGSNGLKLTDIAARMGDKHDTLYRIVSAVYVLQQAESEDLFQVDQRTTRGFSFSHLYTALTYTEYRDFLGLGKADRSADPPKIPVPEDHFDKLEMLLKWLYGSKLENVQPAVRTQNPDLNSLKRVLGHPTARRAMMERGNLAEALEMTVSASDRFDKALFDARAALAIATVELANSRADEELVTVADEIGRRSDLIRLALASGMVFAKQRRKTDAAEKASNAD